MASWSSERGTCHHFTLAEIKKATNSFSRANFLGKGGEGNVYKGVLLDAAWKTIAVKRLHRSGLGKPELRSFENEIKMLSNIRHANLVSLIGYCQESNEYILVYEFMANGNLRDKLTKNINSPLSYEQRVIICIGAARAIEYLHSGTSLDSKIIHRDVKPDNILLNEKMEAKVSDLGMSRIVPANQTHSSVTTIHLCGTPGYYAPEYCMTGKFTWRVDVYSFGMVLLEVLCTEKPPLYGDDSIRNQKADDESFSKWVLRFVDPVLKGSNSENSLEAFINTAEKCLNKDPYKRPTMNEVVGMLDSALKLQKFGDDPSSKLSENGEKRHVDSESKLSCDFRRSKSAKFEKSSSDESYSENSTSLLLISGSTCEESDVESTGEVTNSSQEYPRALLPDIPSTQGKVVLYYDFTSGAMTDYMKIRLFLNKYKVDIEERDPRKNEEYETELSQFLSEKHKEFSLPQIFIGGKHIGGAKDVVRLYNSGELGHYLAVYQH